MVSLLIVLALASAPAMLDLCQINCTGMAAMEQDASSDPVCHREAPDGATLSPLPHACEHGEQAASPTVADAKGAARALHVLLAPGAIISRPPMPAAPALYFAGQHAVSQAPSGKAAVPLRI